MKRWLLLPILLAGCAAHSGVVQIGQDTYLVSHQGWIATQSVGELKGGAFQEAGEYCTSQGRSIQPISSKDTPGVIGRSYPEAEIQFRCLRPSDPELSRPNFEKTPDVLIENRQR